MAKLSAKGRLEVARLTRHTETPLDRDSEWSRRAYALMDDGVLLLNITTKWRAESRPRPTGWRYSGVWGFTRPRDAQAWIDKQVAEGYTLERGARWEMLEDKPQEPLELFA